MTKRYFVDVPTTHVFADEPQDARELYINWLFDENRRSPKAMELIVRVSEEEPRTREADMDSKMAEFEDYIEKERQLLMEAEQKFIRENRMSEYGPVADLREVYDTVLGVYRGIFKRKPV